MRREVWTGEGGMRQWTVIHRGQIKGVAALFLRQKREQGSRGSAQPWKVICLPFFTLATAGGQVVLVGRD